MSETDALAISPENLMDSVFEVLFGYRYETSYKGKFLKELERFRRKFESSHDSCVTRSAIRDWFSGDKPRAPKREHALRFLLELLKLHAEEHRILNGSRKELHEAVIRYLEGEVGNQSLGSKKAAKPPKGWHGNQRTWDNAVSLSGTYQLLRPSATSAGSNRYVLEVMSIDALSGNLDETLFMYSHTQPSRDYLYSGSIEMNYKYCFGLMKRPHEHIDDIYSIRSIVLYSASNKECLSGILLRGVTGQHGAKMAIAAPFVAIKSDFSPNAIKTCAIREFIPLIYLLNDSLLLGEVKRDSLLTNDIFLFCDNIFSSLRNQICHVDGFVLQAIEAQKVCDIIDPDSTEKGAYFEKWRKLVSTWVAASPRSRKVDNI
jgi:hypothetical protein